METIDTGPSCPTDYAALGNGLTEAEWREEAHAEARRLTPDYITDGMIVRGVGSVLQIAASRGFKPRLGEWQRGAESALYLLLGIGHDDTRAAVDRLNASWPGC